MLDKRVGEIRCSKITRGKTHPFIQGFTKINVSSSGQTKYRVLSPMLLGPFEIIEPINPNQFYPSGIHPGFQKLNEYQQIATVQIFENYWQGSKIYNIDLVDGVIQKSFYERRAKLFVDNKGHRRSLPKKKYGVPVSSYYGGMMDYITSRKKIYIPLYEKLVTNLPILKELKQRYLNGENILIVGYDGTDIPITDFFLNDVINDPSFVFGHELVLCSLLKNINLCIHNEGGLTLGLEELVKSIRQLKIKYIKNN
jgi:hypothetical protein